MTIGKIRVSGMNVGTLCHREVVTVCVNDTLEQAARLLCVPGLDAIVAIASPAPYPTVIGMITDRDILCALLEHGAGLACLTVLDILPRNPIVLSQEEDIDGAIVRLTARGARHAPVIGVGGTLRGIISQQMLLDHRNRATACLV